MVGRHSDCHRNPCSRYNRIVHRVPRIESIIINSIRIIVMTKNEAMKIAHEYAAQHHADCDIILYAGEQSGWHFIWLKNSKTSRYSGLGCAINISESGNVSEISSGIEINEIRKSAMRLKQSE